MGKVLPFMCTHDQHALREAVQDYVTVSLARKFYMDPRMKPNVCERLQRLWPYVPEFLKAEIRRMITPVFRKGHEVTEADFFDRMWPDGKDF